MSLPPELDFERNKSGSPARMNLAMEYLYLGLKAATAVKPEYDDAIRQLQGVGLERLDEALTPIFADATTLAQELAGIRAQWIDGAPLAVALDDFHDELVAAGTASGAAAASAAIGALNLGSAAQRTAGLAAGNLAPLDSGAKLPASVIPLIAGTTDTPALIRPFYFYGDSDTFFGRHRAVTFPNPGSKPVIDDYRLWYNEHGWVTSAFQVGLFGAMIIRDQGGVGYAASFVSELQASANNVPFCSVELNINNHKFHSHDAVSQSGILFNNSAAWSTILNLISGGSKRISAALSIAGAPGTAGLNRGITVEGNLVHLHDLWLNTNAINCIWMGGNHAGAAIDGTNLASEVFAAMKNMGSFTAMRSDGTLGRLLRLDAANALRIGEGTASVRSYANLLPAAPNSATVGSVDNPWLKGYFSFISSPYFGEFTSDAAAVAGGRGLGDIYRDTATRFLKAVETL